MRLISQALFPSHRFGRQAFDKGGKLNLVTGRFHGLALLPVE